MAHRQPSPTQLFIVRLWAEEITETEWELRGMVRHISSGDTRYFRTWNRLNAFLSAKASSEKGGEADR